MLFLCILLYLAVNYLHYLVLNGEGYCSLVSRVHILRYLVFFFVFFHL